MEHAGHVGAYCNGAAQIATFTILLPDGTCGMFLMPSAQDVFYLGYTKYALVDNQLGFRIQNPNPNPRQTTAAKTTDNDVVRATLHAGMEYVQHGEKGDSRFLFISPDVSYWTLFGGFKNFGKSRQLDKMEDFEAAHEIRKLCDIVHSKFGPCFIWA